MSLLGSLGLENHPDGSGNINAILNGNWFTLNDSVNPASGFTASQALLVITASGGVFTPEMVGATIRWPDGNTAIIASIGSLTGGYASTATASVSQTVLSQTFEVYRTDTIQTAYSAIARALVKRSIFSTSDNACTIRWSQARGAFLMIPAMNALSLVSNAATLDLSAEALATLPLGNGTTGFTLSSANLFAGAVKRIVVQNGTGAKAVTFPSGWIFVGTKPSSITASKTGLLTLHSTTTADSGVVASYAEQT